MATWICTKAFLSREYFLDDSAIRSQDWHATRWNRYTQFLNQLGDVACVWVSLIGLPAGSFWNSRANDIPPSLPSDLSRPKSFWSWMLGSSAVQGISSGCKHTRERSAVSSQRPLCVWRGYLSPNNMGQQQKKLLPEVLVLAYFIGGAKNLMEDLMNKWTSLSLFQHLQHLGIKKLGCQALSGLKQNFNTARTDLDRLNIWTLIH